MSTILQGRLLMTTKPFLRSEEHCMGKVSDAPASAESKVCSCYGAIVSLQGIERRQMECVVLWSRARGKCIVAVVRGCSAGCPPAPATTTAKERVRWAAFLPERRRPS